MITKIHPNLMVFIGDYEDAANEDLLDDHAIEKIINLSQRLVSYSKYYEMLYINIEDHERENINKYFDETYNFIESAQNGFCFIHCMGGYSRSVTIAIAYIMKKLNKTYEEAYIDIKKERKSIGPNRGFVLQLKEYEYFLRNK
jgi:protein-tyrosine phosphatase